MLAEKVRPAEIEPKEHDFACSPQIGQVYGLGTRVADLAAGADPGGFARETGGAAALDEPEPVIFGGAGVLGPELAGEVELSDRSCVMVPPSLVAAVEGLSVGADPVRIADCEDVEAPALGDELGSDRLPGCEDDPESPLVGALVSKASDVSSPCRISITPSAAC